MAKHERMFHHGHAHKLDDPERKRWLPDDVVVAKLALRPGMNVADVGAGTGTFAIPIARAVAPAGRVFAVDVQQEMLDSLRAKTTPELAIDLVLGEATATTLDSASVDLAFYANVWHEIDDRAAALVEAARILRPAGRVVIVDWRADVERPPGPPPEHRVPAKDVVAELESNGWRVETSEEIGTYHHLVVATRA